MFWLKVTFNYHRYNALNRHAPPIPAVSLTLLLMAIPCSCHVKSLSNAKTYARAKDVMMSILDPDAKNFFSHSCKI